MQLQGELEKYADVASTIAALPKKLTHHVMVRVRSVWDLSKQDD